MVAENSSVIAGEDWEMMKIKKANWSDWFNVSPEAQENRQNLARQHAIQQAISSLMEFQNEPQIKSIDQLRTLQ